jgi:hypothetical protein
VFGRKIRLTCELLFGTPQDKEESTTDYAANQFQWLYDIHHFARQNLKMASDRMKAHYDQLANSAGFQEGERVWLYQPNRRRGKSIKLHTAGNAHTTSSPALTT